MNETNHYFGAYLEIKVEKVNFETEYYGCENTSHAPSGLSAKFCVTCGLPLSEQSVIKQQYPTMIVDWLLDDDWTDILSEITPPSLGGSGVIIAIGNRNSAGVWLHLARYDNDKEIEDFPTDSEVDTMKNSLQLVYSHAITALKESDAVQSVEIKAGYVLDAEY